jgi:hypothetical protein
MKPLPKELDELIDEIHCWMFSGDQKEVAKRARVAESRVSEILNKRIAPNKKVLDAGVEVMNENKARFQVPIKPAMKVA